VELRRFFERALRSSFADLTLRDDGTVDYLSDLLTRFVRVERFHPRGLAVPRLDTVVDMMLEAQHVWRDTTWAPEREVTVRRHIGDYTLFMTGIFRERVESLASTGYYVAEGKRAYHFVSEHDRASAQPTVAGGGPLYRRLADRFEAYAGALDYARKVYFPEHPSRPFLSLGWS
jgi:hypothetical protein